MSPTQRTLADLRKEGYIPWIVEKWNAFAKIRIDLYGIIDVVAIHPDKQGVLGVQTTSDSNMSARVAKASANANLGVWKASGNRFEVWGYGKKGARGERKIWTLRKVVL